MRSSFALLAVRIRVAREVHTLIWNLESGKMSIAQTDTTTHETLEIASRDVGILRKWRAGDKPARFGAEAILLVEDEAFVRDVAWEVLSAAGYQVLSASNAEEALEIYDSQKVRLLLADVILPGLNGFALAKRLKLENPGLRVLLVTGYAEQMSAIEAADQEFLAKPFSAETLVQKVRQMLEMEKRSAETRPA
jgi:two-component system, cell cycle sensor histidine kinase and response regulator CckA